MTAFKDLTSVMSPLTESFDIVPATSETLPQTTRAVFVGVTGDLVVRFSGDSEDRTLKNVAAGVPLPFRLTHVRSTGTTARDIVGFV